MRLNMPASWRGAILLAREGRRRLARPRVAPLSADGPTALSDAEGSDGIVVSVASLIDLWYVTQTTQGISIDDVADLRSRLASSSKVDLHPIDIAVADATTASADPLGSVHRRNRACPRRPACHTTHRHPAGEARRDDLVAGQAPRHVGSPIESEDLPPGTPPRQRGVRCVRHQDRPPAQGLTGAILLRMYDGREGNWRSSRWPRLSIFVSCRYTVPKVRWRDPWPPGRSSVMLVVYGTRVGRALDIRQDGEEGRQAASIPPASGEARADCTSAS